MPPRLPDVSEASVAVPDAPKADAPVADPAEAAAAVAAAQALIQEADAAATPGAGLAEIADGPNDSAQVAGPDQPAATANPATVGTVDNNTVRPVLQQPSVTSSFQAATRHVAGRIGNALFGGRNADAPRAVTQAPAGPAAMPASEASAPAAAIGESPTVSSAVVTEARASSPGEPMIPGELDAAATAAAPAVDFDEVRDDFGVRNEPTTKTDTTPSAEPEFDTSGETGVRDLEPGGPGTGIDRSPAATPVVDLSGPIGDGAVRIDASPTPAGTGTTIDVDGPIGDGAVRMVDGSTPASATGSTTDASGPIGGDPRNATPEQQREGQVAMQRRLLEQGRPINKDAIFPENMGLWERNNGQELPGIVNGVPVGDGAVVNLDGEVPAVSTSGEKLTPEKRRLLTKIKDVLKNRSKSWAEKFDVFTKAGREAKNGKAYILGALLGSAQGISTTALGPLGLPLRFGLSMAVNYGASRLMERYGVTQSRKVNQTLEDRTRVIVGPIGMREGAVWTDEQKRAVEATRADYEQKLAEGRKRVKSFVQGFAAGGTLGSLGVAGFEIFTTNSVKDFFADRARNTKDFVGDVAGGVGDKLGDAKDAIGSIDLNPFNNGAPTVKAPESVPTPLQGNEQPDVFGFSSPTEQITTPVGPQAPEMPFTQVDIKPGDTVTSILQNSGVNVNNPGEYYGSMGDMLKNSWDKFATDRSQMGFGDMPFPRDQLQTVIDQSLAGDAAAQSKLTEAVHWIQSGDKLTVPTAKVAA